MKLFLLVLLSFFITHCPGDGYPPEVEPPAAPSEVKPPPTDTPQPIIETAAPQPSAPTKPAGPAPTLSGISQNDVVVIPPNYVKTLDMAAKSTVGLSAVIMECSGGISAKISPALEGANKLDFIFQAQISTPKIAGMCVITVADVSGNETKVTFQVVHSGPPIIAGVPSFPLLTVPVGSFKTLTQSTTVKSGAGLASVELECSAGISISAKPKFALPDHANTYSFNLVVGNVKETSVCKVTAKDVAGQTSSESFPLAPAQ